MSNNLIDTATKRSLEASSQMQQFDLSFFFPYLVRIFYRAVSDSVSQVYGSLFDLTASEWRVMVVLGPSNVLSASDVVERSSVTKVDVSRAIKSLQKSGLLTRDINGEDKRRASLRLTERGIKVHEILIPLVIQLEKDLTNGLSDEEVISLISMMEKVRENALKITEARTYG